MRAGRLRKLITIEAPSEAKGSTGQTLKTWAAAKRVWAAVEPIRGEEKIVASTVKATLTHRIIIRYVAFPTLTSAHRFRLGSRIFEIVAPPANTSERNVEWVCECREAVT